jgi:hypothetical protein
VDIPDPLQRGFVKGMHIFLSPNSYFPVQTL